jgi:hypothetical protein
MALDLLYRVAIELHRVTMPLYRVTMRSHRVAIQLHRVATINQMTVIGGALGVPP